MLATLLSLLQPDLLDLSPFCFGNVHPTDLSYNSPSLWRCSRFPKLNQKSPYCFKKNYTPWASAMVQQVKMLAEQA